MNTAILFSDAELALAAYANLDSSPLLADSQQAALKNVGLATSQAVNFASRYDVVTQFNDTGTSFSATVFKDVSGNLTLAIRGTLEAGDFVPTDANIGLYGAGYDQIVAMYNWWTRVASPAGQSVSQFQITSYPSIGPTQPPAGALLLYSVPVLDTSFTTDFYLESAPAVVATGELDSALGTDPDHRVAVTGHSLGAHLSLAFNTLFPGVTNDVTGFDTPGIEDTTVNRQFFNLLGGSIPTPANSNDVTNIIADESSIGDKPWNAIAGLYSPPGTTIKKNRVRLG